MMIVRMGSPIKGSDQDKSFPHWPAQPNPLLLRLNPRRQFTAREEDGTGLYYYRARYYHPVLGRFLSEDPIEYEEGDMNLYVYVENSPIQFTDILGLSTDKYVADRFKHGGPHVDRYTKNGKKVGRYRPNGEPMWHKGKCPPRIPNSDWARFLKAADQLFLALSLMPYVDYGEPVPAPYEKPADCEGNCPPGYSPIQIIGEDGCPRTICYATDRLG